jgi:hypothetical protein
MAELKPVKRGNRGRIPISWPNYNSRLFGDFENEAEAAHWFKEP